MQIANLYINLRRIANPPQRANIRCDGNIRRDGCSPDTALRDLQDLVAKGILVRTDSGGRSTGYDLVK